MTDLLARLPQADLESFVQHREDRLALLRCGCCVPSLLERVEQRLQEAKSPRQGLFRNADVQPRQLAVAVRDLAALLRGLVRLRLGNRWMPDPEIVWHMDLVLRFGLECDERVHCVLHFFSQMSSPACPHSITDSRPSFAAGNRGRRRFWPAALRAQ
jgi:hypothetical protein